MPKTSAAAGKNNIVNFRRRLEQQQQEMSDRLSSTVEQGREAASDPAPDAVDQAVFTYQKEFLFSRGTKEHDTLQHVKQALNRIKEGSFGKCVECEQPIGEKRLEALPWTPYCIQCQEKLEQAAEAERRAS